MRFTIIECMTSDPSGDVHVPFRWMARLGATIATKVTGRQYDYAEAVNS